jgi:hypothetical protein
MKDVYCDVLSHLESLVRTRTVVLGLDGSVEFSFHLYSLNSSVLMARMIIGNGIRSITFPTADGVTFGVVRPVGEKVGVPVGGGDGSTVGCPVGGEVGGPVDGPVGGEDGDPVDGPVGGEDGGAQCRRDGNT